VPRLGERRRAQGPSSSGTGGDLETGAGEGAWDEGEGAWLEGARLDLARELRDPLKAARISLVFRGFSTALAAQQRAPVNALVLALRFFNMPALVSQRIPLVMRAAPLFVRGAGGAFPGGTCTPRHTMRCAPPRRLHS
jgi:hypothetical protein